LLCWAGGLLVFLALYLGRLVWTRSAGPVARRRLMGLTVCQCGAFGIAALGIGVVCHLVNDEGFLVNTAATASLQKAYAGAFVPRISRSETRRLLAGGAIVVDARMTSDYDRGHLAGAISIPVDANEAMWKKATASLPSGKPVVVYCQSAGCKFAESVSLQLMREGFKDISIYRGGWNEWVATDSGSTRETGTKGRNPNGGHVWIPERGRTFRS
jgi:rhodanese-related sulfurtransferase